MGIYIGIFPNLDFEFDSIFQGELIRYDIIHIVIVLVVSK